MAPKAKKSSYIQSFDAFHLTCWNGAMRLVGPSSLTYWPENHIPMSESVSFFIFKFLSDIWFKCVFGYVNAWVLLWGWV